MREEEKRLHVLSMSDHGRRQAPAPLRDRHSGVSICLGVSTRTQHRDRAMLQSIGGVSRSVLAARRREGRVGGAVFTPPHKPALSAADRLKWNWESESLGVGVPYESHFVTFSSLFSRQRPK